jgi:hypothetical protein
VLAKFADVSMSEQVHEMRFASAHLVWRAICWRRLGTLDSAPRRFDLLASFAAEDADEPSGRVALPARGWHDLV